MSIVSIFVQFKIIKFGLYYCFVNMCTIEIIKYGLFYHFVNICIILDTNAQIL